MSNSQSSKDKNIPVKIDKEPIKFSDPITTGAELYDRGDIDESQYDLYREVRGNGDDEFIANDNTKIELKPGDHFYSAQKSLNPGGNYE